MGTAGVVRVHGWMLQRMAAPCDLDAFHAAASEIATQPAGPDGQVALTGLALFHLSGAAFLKWPMAVRVWASSVAGSAEASGVSADASGGGAAQFYADTAVDMSSSCGRADLTWMHDQIIFGTQNVMFGPFVFLEKLKS